MIHKPKDPYPLKLSSFLYMIDTTLWRVLKEIKVSSLFTIHLSTVLTIPPTVRFTQLLYPAYSHAAFKSNVRNVYRIYIYVYDCMYVCIYIFFSVNILFKIKLHYTTTWQLYSWWIISDSSICSSSACGCQFAPPSRGGGSQTASPYLLFHASYPTIVSADTDFLMRFIDSRKSLMLTFLMLTGSKDLTWL